MKTIKDISFELSTQALDFACFTLGMQPSFQTAKEVRFYEDGKLRLYINGPKAGKWKNFSDDSHGDLISLYLHAKGCSFAEALEAAKSWLGVENKPKVVFVPTETNTVSDEEENQKRKQIAQFLWKQSGIVGAHGIEYLQNRHLDVIKTPWMKGRLLDDKAKEKMRLDLEGDVYSLVFGATDNDGELSAVQQVLIMNGRKAPVNDPKRTNGLLRGACVKLIKPTDELVLAEGPETALSVIEITDKPTWIALGTSNYANIIPPNTVKTLGFAVDLELGGNGIFGALKGVSSSTTENVMLLIPDNPITDDKIDFNDTLAKYGKTKAKEKTITIIRKKKNHDFEMIASCSRNALGLFALDSVIAKSGKIGKEEKIVPDIHFNNQISHHRFITDIFPEHLAEWKKRNTDHKIEWMYAPKNVFWNIFIDQKNINLDDYFQDFQAPLVYGLWRVPYAQKVVICQNKRSSDVLGVFENMCTIAVDPNKNPARVNWNFLKGKEVILAPTKNQNAIKHIAHLAKTIRGIAANVKMYDWPILKPDMDGNLKSRTDDLPLNYDLYSSISEGWSKDKLLWSLSSSSNLLGSFEETELIYEEEKLQEEAS